MKTRQGSTIFNETSPTQQQPSTLYAAQMFPLESRISARRGSPFRPPVVQYKSDGKKYAETPSPIVKRRPSSTPPTTGIGAASNGRRRLRRRIRRRAPPTEPEAASRSSVKLFFTCFYGKQTYRVLFAATVVVAVVVVSVYRQYIRCQTFVPPTPTPTDSLGCRSVRLTVLFIFHTNLRRRMVFRPSAEQLRRLCREE